MLTRSTAISSASRAIRSPSRVTTPWSMPRAACRIAFAIAALRRVPVGDHRQAAKAEKVGAAVRVRVEMGAETADRGLDQHAARLAPGGRRDLAAKPVERRPDRPLDRLQDDVARETVADDDVGRMREEPAALDVALEAEVARPQQLVRLERELVSLLRLLADRQQPDRRRAGCRGSPARTRSPSAPNCSRCSARQSAFAPASISTDGPFGVGMTTAIAGRSTPRRRRT